MLKPVNYLCLICFTTPNAPNIDLEVVNFITKMGLRHQVHPEALCNPTLDIGF